MSHRGGFSNNARSSPTLTISAAVFIKRLSCNSYCTRIKIKTKLSSFLIHFSDLSPRYLKTVKSELFKRGQVVKALSMLIKWSILPEHTNNFVNLGVSS